MAVIIIRRGYQYQDLTGSSAGGSGAQFTTATAPQYSSHDTAPVGFNRVYTIVSLAAKRQPQLLHRGQKLRKQFNSKPSELEIAFAAPTSSSESTSADFSFEMLSHSFVPNSFPSQEPRSESAYTRRG